MKNIKNEIIVMDENASAINSGNTNKIPLYLSGSGA
jgi:ABC-type phosphate transport system ATPase subunit